MQAERPEQFANAKPVSQEVESVLAAVISEAHAQDVLRSAFIGIIDHGFDELTVRQLGILFLVRDEKHAISDIAEKLSISISSASRSCTTLCTKKLTRSEPDGHKRMISLSPKGEAMIGRAMSTIIQKI